MGIGLLGLNKIALPDDKRLKNPYKEVMQKRRVLPTIKMFS